jgi:hypothetical protein
LGGADLEVICNLCLILKSMSWKSCQILRADIHFFFFCRARWLMPPDVPQPVRLIVLTLL